MILGPSRTDLAIISETPIFRYAEELLDSCLEKAGLPRSNFYFNHLAPDTSTEWVSARKTPPTPEWVMLNGKWVHPLVAESQTRLLEQLKEVQPRLIFTLGGMAMWALLGETGLLKWRGSRLTWAAPWGPVTVVPSYHPDACVAEPALRHQLLLDLKRGLAIYEGRQLPRSYQFQLEPTFEQAKDRLLYLISWANVKQAAGKKLSLSGDLETRFYHIACLGIAWSETEAICIPFLRIHPDNPFYWSEEDETFLTNLIQTLFLHPGVEWIGQNFLYDCQYFYRFWGVYPPVVFDTMIGHHAVFPTMRKGLDFLSSIYAQDHIYWKDEIKNWDPSIGERQFWEYNCKDACITYEITPCIKAVAASQEVTSNQEFQQSLFHPVLRMMNRGIRINLSERAILKKALLQQAYERQENLDFMAGHPLNPRSIVQLKAFFYTDLKLPGIRSMTSEGVTLNSAALNEISQRVPALKKICQTITELRSIGVFLSTFINAELDSDGRMRCSFSIAGPITFRFSSSENAFGSGMNLQNIPVAEKEKIKSADYIHLPNIRKLFIPDPGFTFWDMDLDRADLQVVVWEADDSLLKHALRTGIDMHCMNACDIFDIKGIPYDELAENHPNYRNHRARIGDTHRQKAKMGVHATNYGVGDYKLAQSLGVSTHEASRFRSRWFAAHPGIRAWQVRVEHSASTRGWVQNQFGARLPIMGRFDLPEALAWVPQSTVARVINQALINIDQATEKGETTIQLLVQVHDSLAGQFPIEREKEEVENLRQLARVEIPYPEPLVIPVGINLSSISWGDCKG